MRAALSLLAEEQDRAADAVLATLDVAAIRRSMEKSLAHGVTYSEEAVFNDLETRLRAVAAQRA